MIICVKCKIEMKAEKNGVGADFGNGHIYAGDRYQCPQCGAMILKTNATACYDPKHKNQEEYLIMN